MLAYATASGLSVADFSNLSLGFVIDFCITKIKLQKGEDLHKDEKNYYKLKDILPFVIEQYKNGKISDSRFREFMNNFTRLEELYGWH